MTFFNYNFLCVQSFTLEFGIAVLTAFFTILTLLIVVFNVSELSSMLSGNPIVLVIIFLLLLTWSTAIAGASSRSRKLIALSIVIWAIFVIVWLILSLYFRILMQNTDFCVALKTRCAPSMWLIGSGGGSANNETDSAADDDASQEDTDDDLREWSIIDSPEIILKTFHPVRTNVIPQAIPVAVTPAANTVISNQTSTMIGVNNGCGCERYPQTTTENPPSDLVTRVIEYRKNMAMFRQTAEAVIQRRKKKEGKKKKEVDKELEGEKLDPFSDESDDNGSGSGSGESPVENDNEENKAEANPTDYLAMAIFLHDSR